MGYKRGGFGIKEQKTPNKRVAILGGTFNPIHNGHLFLAREFAALLGLQKVLLIPTRVPPHKTGAGLVSGTQRLAMCRLAAEEEPLLSVSDMELKRSGKSYTADTLRELHAQDPSAEYYFLMGADMFLTVESWSRAEEIFALATLCAAPRGPSDAAALRAHGERLARLGARVVVAAFTPPAVSSTQIRKLAARGGSIEGLTPWPVAEYIRLHGLYREDD